MCSGYGARPYNQIYKTDVSYAIDQNLTIYIPYMEKEYATIEYIQRIFKSLDIGDIDYVHFENNAAIIYMKRFYNNVTVQNLQEKIKDRHRQARLVHDDPDYWVLLENNDSKKMITEQVAYTETLNATMNQIVGKLEQLSDKLKLHDIKIKDLYKNNVESDLVIKNLGYYMNVTLPDKYWAPGEQAGEQPFGTEKANANIMALMEKRINKVEAEASAMKTETSIPVKNIYKNNSCCGAASDAWIPNYPSNDTSNWREWRVSKL